MGVYYFIELWKLVQADVSWYSCRILIQKPPFGRSLLSARTLIKQRNVLNCVHTTWPQVKTKKKPVIKLYLKGVSSCCLGVCFFLNFCALLPGVRRLDLHKREETNPAFLLQKRTSKWSMIHTEMLSCCCLHSCIPAIGNKDNHQTSVRLFLDAASPCLCSRHQTPASRW